MMMWISAVPFFARLWIGSLDRTASFLMMGKWHIPPDLVVDQRASDVESCSNREILFLHSVWTAFGRLIRDKIISAISIG